MGGRGPNLYPPSENSAPPLPRVQTAISFAIHILMFCHSHPLQSLDWGGEEAPTGQSSSSQDQELLGKGERMCRPARGSFRNP